jgi:serine/threonine-protein kinase
VQDPDLADTLSSGPLGAQRALGAAIGPYVTEALLGQGAMGVVFRARHRETGEEVALKVLLAGVAQDARHRRRFKREVELLARLQHPNVVRLRGHGEAGRLAWLAMQLVDGETLASRLDRMGRRALVRALEQVARGLGAAHAEGIVHRDVKPANILLRPDGTAVLTDLGLGRDLEQRSSLTQSGSMLGTPLYMAPEQASGAATSPATDVHALGVILYQGLCGRAPWPAGQSSMALLQSIRTLRPRRPSSVTPGVPRALDAICARALEKQPARRYPDGDAFAEALAAFLAGRAVETDRRAPWVLPLAAGALTLAGALGLAAALSGSAPSGSDEGATPVAGAPGPPAAEGSAEAPPLAGSPAPDVEPPPPPPRSVELRPGPLLGHDTFVRNDGLYWNDNRGSDSVLLVGDRSTQKGDFRALLRFDLGRIPPDARVERATLRLRASTRQLRLPLEVLAHLIVPTEVDGVARTPWREGTSTQDAHLDGVCWDGALAGAPATTVNSGRPDLTQPDVDQGRDFGHGPTGLVARARLSPGQGALELDVTGAVRAWLEAPASNHGLRLAHAAEGPPYEAGHASLSSSDHRDPERRPRLTVVYRGAEPAPPADQDALWAEARRRARRLLGQAREADDAGDPASALRMASGAVEAAPFLGEAYALRGAIAKRLGYGNQALYDFEHARIVAEPDSSPGLLGQEAEVRLGMGDVRGAQNRVQRALAEAPDDPALKELEARIRAHPAASGR